MIERVPALMPAGMVLLSLALVLMSLLVARGRPS